MHEVHNKLLGGEKILRLVSAFECNNKKISNANWYFPKGY